MGITGIPPPYGCATLSISMDENLGENSIAKLPETSRYTLSVKETATLFEQAGVPRTERSIQLYCKYGHLDCITDDDELTLKYRIHEGSARRRIEILQIAKASKEITNARETSGKFENIREVSIVANSGHSEGEAAKKEGETKERYLKMLEGQVDRKDKQIEKLNETIDDLIERDRETNILIQNLQSLLMLGAPKTGETSRNGTIDVKSGEHQEENQPEQAHSEGEGDNLLPESKDHGVQ